MNLTAGQIADQINGTIVGDRDVDISNISKIEEGKKGSLTFLANPKYTEFIYSTNASAAIVSNDFEPTERINTTLIKVKDPYVSFTTILELFNKEITSKQGISEFTVIDNSAKISDSSYIGSFTTIGKNSEVSDNCIIENQVFIGNNVEIGEGTRIFPGVKILDDTKIGKNCIIQIAHNVEIGENTAIAAQSGIAGSTKIGKNCMIGGQVGIIGHLKIGDNVKIQAQAGVTSDIKSDSRITGTPAISYMNYNKSYIHFKNLPEIVKKIDNKD